MKSKFLIFISCLLCSCLGVFAYEFPSDIYYIDASVAQLGNIRIVFNSNIEKCISFTDDNQPINTCNSTMYGFINSGSSEYRVTFSTFERATVRRTDYSSQSFDLVVNSITDSNIPKIYPSDYYTFPKSEIILISGIALIGGLLWIMCLRR